MTTSENKTTQYLEQLLAKHKKRYIEWDQLLKKITKPWKTKLGLNETSSELDVKNALHEYLGDHLILADKLSSILCLAERMSPKELEQEFIAEENALLQKALAKGKKNYIGWAVLLKDLELTGRKKFGLTPKSSWLEVQEAIEPFCGHNLFLYEVAGEGYLASNMTEVELQTEIDAEKAKIAEENARIAAEKARIATAEKARKVEEKTQFLKALLVKAKAKILPLELNEEEQKFFGIKKSKTGPTASALEKTLTPFCGSELELLKKKVGRKEVLYLAYKIPHEEFIKESCLAHGSKEFSPEKIAEDVPIDKKEFTVLFSRMLETGQLQVTKIDEKFTITGVKLASGTTAPTTPRPVPQPTHQHVSGQDDTQLFRAAFEKLDRGRIYVRICNMRRELGWSEERFNVLLRKLRADGTIQLHAGDVSSMTEEDVNLSYIDENNLFYATLTWKKS
jgi:hypothetical protein